ncbi:cyclic AMP-responsive element-binding protein 3-like [Mytilus californianus]|uniref:cyclic AMP-responsive element-binding protein 3-like n=1 Tax=Mytilus californianus TaxID=6549 RepID=UPI002245EC7B|nr:cyclic AMP-responsive element-binding protein 3-like [Mytilus californianus]
MMKVPRAIEETKFNNEDDEKIVGAIKQCLEDDSCLPLLKEEIKLKIQCKRVISGEEELKVEHRRPVKYLLTEEEVFKRNRRKEQNRKSAVRTRARQKARIAVLEKEVNSLEEDQCSLEQTIDSLRTELQTLDNLFKIHKCSKVKLNSTCRLSIPLQPTVNNLVMLGGI